MGRAFATLPRGGALGDEGFRAVHTWVCRLLWAHAVTLPIYGIVQGYGVLHAVTEGGLVVAGFALAASLRGLGNGVRSLSACVGLVTASVVLVHFSGGMAETHFHFFVVVIVASLYQSWRPFLTVLGIVSFHHAVVGNLAPALVFDDPTGDPLAVGLFHGGLVIMTAGATLVAWRINEDALVRERQAGDDLAEAQRVAAVGSWEWEPSTDKIIWSAELHRIFGIDSSAAITVTGLAEMIHPDDRDRVVPLFKSAYEHDHDLDFECRILRPDGHTRTVHVLGTIVRHATKPVRMLGTGQDITERKALELEVTRRAFYDDLTGLANRALFLNRLDVSLAATHRSGEPVSVLFLDLDSFKGINDRYGHRAGDELLAEVARRIEAVVRDCDTAARLGGDEFAILLEGVDADNAAATARRVLTSLQFPVRLTGHEVRTAASIGIADNGQAHDTETLLHHADLAMYVAKERGNGTVEVFRPALTKPLPSATTANAV